MPTYSQYIILGLFFIICFLIALGRINKEKQRVTTLEEEIRKLSSTNAELVKKLPPYKV